MSIVQEPESTAHDPRWILLRVSRINLLVNGVGVLVALGILGLVPLSHWLRAALAVVFVSAFLWDVRLILLRSIRSVSAFYLFDLDTASEQAVTSPQPAKMGIRVRYAIASGLADAREDEGVILSGAFVSPWFTAVRYTLPHDPRWRKWWPHIIPLWSDSVAADAFRQLRVALKWK